MKEQSKHKIEARFGLSMPENPYSNLLFDHIDGFEFFLNFLGSKFGLSSPTSRGDNCLVPGTHNCPWSILTYAEISSVDRS